jgi:hypothetical protein
MSFRASEISQRLPLLPQDSWGLGIEHKNVSLWFVRLYMRERERERRDRKREKKRDTEKE